MIPRIDSTELAKNIAKCMERYITYLTILDTRTINILVDMGFEIDRKPVGGFMEAVMIYRK